MHVRYCPTTADDQAFIARATRDPDFARNYHESGSLASMRAGARHVAGNPAVRHVPPDTQVVPLALAGVPCERISAPGAHPARTIVYLHGGGFVRGSLDLQRANAAFIAHASGTQVLAVGYRQAPEHPFPAAGSDVAAVYAALLAQGADPRRTTVLGESSGGCLALGLAVALRDSPAQLPAGIAALSPMVDLTLQGASWYYNAHRDVADLATGQRLVDLYLAGADPTRPEASPLAHDFARCCPLLVSIGSHETMLSDAEHLARKASDAGAHVELQIHEAMLHGFTRFNTAAADHALEAAARWCLARMAD